MTEKPKYKPSLNYIDLMNRFWEVNLEFDFTGNEAKLYFYLLHISNSLAWKNPFKHSLRQIQSGTRISLNSIKAAQSRLSKSGLISIKIGIPGNRFDISNKTEYQILSVSKFDTGTGTGTDTDMNTGIDTATDTITKGNKTRKYERVKFTPPSLFEIQSYFQEKITEKGFSLNPVQEAEKFESFYSSKDWWVGKNKMADWRKAVSGWIARDQTTGAIQPKSEVKLNPEWL